MVILGIALVVGLLLLGFDRSGIKSFYVEFLKFFGIKPKFSDNTKLAFIEKVKANRVEFGNKVVDMAARLDTIPNAIMVTMNNETAGTMSHTIKNPNSSAIGLIQFTKETAQSLGTTSEALVEMSNIEQLDYVEKYLERYKSKFKVPADVYLAVFYPLALYQNDSWEFPQWAVKANPIFDLNKDGRLTKAEFVKYVNQKYSKYF